MLNAKNLLVYNEDEGIINEVYAPSLQNYKHHLRYIYSHQVIHEHKKKSYINY